MGERRFLLVDSSALPDVFLKVLQAKELLASGSVSNISTAARQAGISRSAFYKYKDYVFDAETGREAITVIATLLDKTGALQSLLSGISAAGASVVTITQSRPENGTAQVEVTVRTGTMQMTVEEMLTRLARQSFCGGSAPRNLKVNTRRQGAQNGIPDAGSRIRNKGSMVWLKLQSWDSAPLAAVCWKSAAATPHPLPAARVSRWRSSTSWMCVIFLILRTQRCL